MLLNSTSLKPWSGVVTEILKDEIFFSARNSSISFKRAPRATQTICRKPHRYQTVVHFNCTHVS